jgi:two-component system chemotaxis response regulator CheB
MQPRDIIVIGASAEGVEALQNLVGHLPNDYKGTMFIVLHTKAYQKSTLAEILSNIGSLKAEFARDGAPVQKGRIYIAPSDFHLLVENSHMLVRKGPKENRFRPSIDALFRSAAYTYGPRVVGVILSGLLDDGTSGLWTVKRLGGIAIVQSPSEALFPSMPYSAHEHVEADYIVSANEIPYILNKLYQDSVDTAAPCWDSLSKQILSEIKIAALEALPSDLLYLGRSTNFTCPECGRNLLLIQEGNWIRYRCEKGHAFNDLSLFPKVYAQ